MTMTRHRKRLTLKVRPLVSNTIPLVCLYRQKQNAGQEAGQKQHGGVYLPRYIFTNTGRRIIVFRDILAFIVLCALTPAAFIVDIGLQLVEWLEQEEDAEFYPGA